MEDYKVLFKTAMLAGEIMLKSGAEAYRVEDTMKRILSLSHFTVVETFCMSTGIFATLDDPSIEPFTRVLRISERNNDLNRIHLVNMVSRELCGGEIGEKEAYKKLLEIQTVKAYTSFEIFVVTILTTSSFTVLFGGGLPDAFVAAGNGILIVLLSHFLIGRSNAIIRNGLEGVCMAVFTTLCIRFCSTISVDTILVGSIMPLVPGVAITNAIRDTLEGDYVSGISRAAEAFITSIGIAAGIGLGLSLFHVMGSGMI